MAAASGNLLLLKVGDGASPETFTTVAGLKSTGLTLNNAPVDITTKDSNHYKTLLAGGGVKDIAVSAAGVFTDATSEETVRGYAFNNSQKNYRIYLPNGHYIQGAFMITQYQRSSNNDDKEDYSISLASTGSWTYT